MLDAKFHNSIRVLVQILHHLEFAISKNPEKCLNKNPNLGICAFEFLWEPTNTTQSFKYHYQQGLEPFMHNWDGKKESLYEGKTYSCKGDASTNGNYCSTIIKLNGWKIPADYPRKIQY